jgi:nitrite reductase (NADH) small subunit
MGCHMQGFVPIAKVTDLPLGRARAFPLGDRLVAVFYDGHEYLAINDFCPHMGASLADGEVQDGIVTCPWHAWRFRLCDGTWCDNPRIRTESYEVKIHEGTILVRQREVPPATAS